MSSNHKPFPLGALRNFAYLAAILILAVAFDMLVRFLVSKGVLDPSSFSYDCVAGLTVLIEACDTLVLGTMVIRHTWDAMRAQIWPAKHAAAMSQVEGPTHALMVGPARARSPKSRQRAMPGSQNYPPDPDGPPATSSTLGGWSAVVAEFAIYLAAGLSTSAIFGFLMIQGFRPLQAAGATLLIVAVTQGIWMFTRWIQQTVRSHRLSEALGEPGRWRRRA